MPEAKLPEKNPGHSPVIARLGEANQSGRNNNSTGRGRHDGLRIIARTDGIVKEVNAVSAVSNPFTDFMRGALR
jgi:hypothetical protein